MTISSAHSKVLPDPQKLRNGSEECTYPSDRHKKDVPFMHVMGGSTNRCYNINK